MSRLRKGEKKEPGAHDRSQTGAKWWLYFENPTDNIGAGVGDIYLTFSLDEDNFLR